VDNRNILAAQRSAQADRLSAGNRASSAAVLNARNGGRYTGTLQALTQLVGRDRSKAPKRNQAVRNIPKGKAYGWHHRFDGGGKPGRYGPNNVGNGDASRRANFDNELAMNRRRNVGAPRRSAPKPPIY
jgi:hypothetical protein